MQRWGWKEIRHLQVTGSLWRISGMGVVMSDLEAVLKDSRWEARANRQLKFTKAHAHPKRSDIHWPLGKMAWEEITHTLFELFKKQVDS